MSDRAPLRRRVFRAAPALLTLVTLLLSRSAPLLLAGDGKECCARCHDACACCHKGSSPRCAVRADCSRESPVTAAGFPQTAPALLVSASDHAGLTGTEFLLTAPHQTPAVPAPDPPDRPPRRVA